MISSRANGLFNGFVVLLLMVLSVTFVAYLALLRLLYFDEDNLNVTRYGYYWFIASLGLLIQLFWNDRTLSVAGIDFLKAVRQALSQTAYVAGALLLTLVLVKDGTISRLFFFTYLPILYLGLVAGNFWGPRWLSRILFTERHCSSAVVIGSPASAKKMRGWFADVAPYGLKISGLLTFGPTSSHEKAIPPLLGEVEDLPTLLADPAIRTVILLDIPEPRNLLHFIVEATERRGVRLITLNPLTDIFRHSVHYVSHLGVDFISLRAEPLEDPMLRATKRAVDIVISAGVIVFALPPLCLLVWLAHRWQSPGPLFYRQPRTGIRGEHFSIYKFRTMTVGHNADARQADAHDARIFPLGRLLRKTSLDEFPQFLNVLSGQMSVVGPRPHMPEHDKLFAKAMDSYHVRSLVKPGVTGLAQVRGFRGEARSARDIQRRIECDIEYIEEWSLVLDLYIILKTAVAVVRPPQTAY